MSSTRAVSLHSCYAVSVAEVECAATTPVRAATYLRAWYAMPGTDIPCVATSGTRSGENR
eukprot:3761969-Rhodomonas_salina.1